VNFGYKKHTPKWARRTLENKYMSSRKLFSENADEEK